MSSDFDPSEFVTIPEGWTCKRLIDCTIDDNLSYGIVQPGQHVSNGILVIRINNINNGQLDLQDVLKVDPEIEKKYQRTRLEGGEVLLTLVGSTGQSFVAPPELKGWNVPRAIAVIRADQKIGSDWINICLQSKETKHFLDVRANTTVQKTLNLKDVRDIPILLPPKEVKELIEGIATSIAKKIELNRKTNQTLEQIAQALFKSWFVDFEPTRAKIFAKEAGASPEEIERAAMCAISGKTPDQLAQLPPETQQNLKTTATLFPDALVDSELGEVPEGWEAGSLKDCCIRVESGGTPSRNESSYWNGGIKWLSSGEVRDVIALSTKETISPEGLKNSSAKLWPFGTTVVAMYGATAGQVCMLANEMSANQACCALIPRATSRCYLFLTARLSVDELLGKASGSAQQNLNKSLVADHRILLPSDSILELFENSVTSLIGTWIKNTGQNLVLGETRDNLLPKLLSGEIQL